MLFKKDNIESSEFSVFIREASSREKKRVFKRVINDAIESQDNLVKTARRLVLANR